jgi:hypothetical protein
MTIKWKMASIVLLLTNAAQAQAEPVCKLATMRIGPDLPPRVVEVCTVTEAQEAAIRKAMTPQSGGVLPSVALPPPWLPLKAGP